ncbi:MAG: preprotein translocase subunit SecE [Planctomycetota bacterium]|nr:preprotein translocase subunit SecE [Planctomycetota bacterium]
MTVICGGFLAVLGAYWIWESFGTASWGVVSTIYVQAGAAIAFAALCGYMLWKFVAKSVRAVDFLVATEAEMKKVNWSTRRELVGSSIIVILSSMMIALFCLAFDLVFTRVFTWMKVLHIDEGMGF